MKRRHVYSPPKGSRFARFFVVIFGGLFCAFFVFYFIPLLQRLESSLAPVEETVENVEVVPPPPEDYQSPDEPPPPEEEPEPEPEMVEESNDLDISLELPDMGSGVGSTVIQIAPKFTLSADDADLGFGGDVDVAPKPTTRFPPRYPQKLKQRKVQGKVLVSASVDENGVVTEAGVKQSSGHKALDDAAIKAILKWKFKPGLRGGTPVKAKVVQPFSFKLNNA